MANPGGKLTAAALMLIIVAGTCSVALADGKVFSNATPRVNIPDQSALICFDGRTERLIIETGYEGEGTEFAWVVPVPAPPEVEAASPGLFATLRLLFRPRVALDTAAEHIPYRFVLLLAATVCLAIAARRSWSCVLVLVIAWGIIGVNVEKRWWHAWGGPTRAAVPAEAGAPAAGVTVHEERIVGSYYVATLSATGAEELLTWLNENGYKVDTDVKPVLDEYAKEGWCFVAARLRRDVAGRERGATHPLSFTFPAKKAVYPLRLTAVGSNELSLALYVFGKQEARAAGLSREQTGYVDRPENYHEWDAFAYTSHKGDAHLIPVVHEELSKIVGALPVATKLSGKFSPGQMKRDLRISWKKPAPHREVLYTAKASARLSAAIGALTALGLTLLCATYAAWKTHTHRKVHIQLRWVMLLALAALFLVLMAPHWRYVVSDRATYAVAVRVILCGVGLCALALFLPRQPIADWFSSEMYFVGMVVWPVVVTWRIPDPVYLGLALAAVIALIAGGVYAMHSAEGRPGGIGGRRLVLLFAASLLVSLISWGAARYVTSPEGALIEREDVREENRGIEHLVDAVESKATAGGKTVWEIPVDDCRKVFAEVAPSIGNIYTDQPLREENSPGNYTIEEKDGKGVLYYYDINGMKFEGTFHRARWRSLGIRGT